LTGPAFGAARPIFCDVLDTGSAGLEPPLPLGWVGRMYQLDHHDRYAAMEVSL